MRKCVLTKADKQQQCWGRLHTKGPDRMWSATRGWDKSCLVSRTACSQNMIRTSFKMRTSSCVPPCGVCPGLCLQVCAMRMPVDMLLQWMPQIMEGMLIWSDDSKNKFRLKVRRLLLLQTGCCSHGGGAVLSWGRMFPAVLQVFVLDRQQDRCSASAHKQHACYFWH